MIQGDYLYFAPLFLQKCYRLIFLTLINFKKPRTYCTAWDRLALSIILETHSKMARTRPFPFFKDVNMSPPSLSGRFCSCLFMDHASAEIHTVLGTRLTWAKQQEAQTGVKLNIEPAFTA